MIRSTICILFLGAVVVCTVPSQAQVVGNRGARASRNPQEPGWARPTFALPQQQAVIEATPIYLRPYRPLHFYGNTVRRQYYRGVAIPLPRDAANAAAAALGRHGHVSEYVGRGAGR
jgi:hypothetical protein